MNLLNLSGSTWQYICTALIALAITSCVIGVWRDSRRERRQAPRLTGSRLTRVLAAHDQAEAALRSRMPSLGMAPGHTWPGDCPNCVWWHPAPSEAEDAIAVYQPCPVHDPALWAEMEKRVAQ